MKIFSYLYLAKNQVCEELRWLHASADNAVCGDYALRLIA